MDRELAPNVRRQARLKTAFTFAAPLIVIAIALVMLPGWLRPGLRRDRIRTAVVTSGPIDATISASGLVVPAIERVISSPLDARVLRILQRPGASVRRGDAVMELDVAESQVAFEKSENDLKVKDNQQRQTTLSYEKSLVDLDGKIKVKALEIETRRATLDGHRKLAGLGLLSKEELRTSELAVQQAEIELAQFKDERINAQQATALQIEGLQLERATLDREVGERRRQLELATTKADRDGVLTWIVTQEGALVRRGDVLARIADLSSFRVDATASDVHVGAIRPGLRAIVRIDALTLQGQVSEVYPSVENGSLAIHRGPGRGRAREPEAESARGCGGGDESARAGADDQARIAHRQRRAPRRCSSSAATAPSARPFNPASAASTPSKCARPGRGRRSDHLGHA